MGVWPAILRRSSQSEHARATIHSRKRHHGDSHVDYMYYGLVWPDPLAPSMYSDARVEWIDERMVRTSGSTNKRENEATSKGAAAPSSEAVTHSFMRNDKKRLTSSSSFHSGEG